MAQFNLSDYDPVEDRIKKFYKDFPNGRIHTSIEFDDGKRIVFKAMLYRDLPLSANADVERGAWTTGFAEEIRGEGYVNKTSALENCETSAIGRALANANYAGSKRPSREEMQKTTQAPPKEPQAVSEGVKLTGAISEPQRSKIFALLKEVGINGDDNRHKLLERLVGKDSISKLTKSEAGEVIEFLEGQRAE